MTTKSSSFGKKVFNNTAFSLIDILITKSTTILAFVLLVRMLPEESIAAIGIATGYLIFISYFDVAPIRVLLRDYPKIAQEETKRNELLTALFLFWFMQTTLMLVVAFVLCIFLLGPFDIVGLQFLYLAMAFDFIVLTLQGWIKTVYYANFMQRTATKISLFIGLVRFSAYIALFISPMIETYALILVLTALAASIIWIFSFQKQFQFHFIFHRGTPKVLWQSLLDYGLWDHFNRTVIDTLFTIDLVILSWFVMARDMSSYTIALKFASLLTLIPAQLNAALQVTLSNYQVEEKRNTAINTLLKVNGLISIMQLVVILLFGDWLIRLLFGQEINTDVVNYALIISIGVTIFNLCYPLIGIVNNYCRLKHVFILVFLPALIISCATYYVAAAQYGAAGVAYSNIIAYTTLALGLSIYVKYHYPISIKFKLITSNEAELIKEILGRRQK